MPGESILTHLTSHIPLFLLPWESVEFWKTQQCLSHWHSFSVLRSVHDLHQKLLMDGIACSVFGFQRKGTRWDYDILLLTCKRVRSFFPAVNEGLPVYFQRNCALPCFYRVDHPILCCANWERCNLKGMLMASLQVCDNPRLLASLR